MGLTPSLRRLTLTLHILSAVGWLGAVVAFLTLTVAGLAGQDGATLRAVYLGADVSVRFAVVPLGLASLATGMVQALATPWGLFRHYWVVFKLVLAVPALLVLLQYTQTVAYFAQLARQTDVLSPVGLWSYLLHSGGGLLILVLNTRP